MYARKFDDQVYDFGVLGVEQGTLILYDAQTRSRWSQLFGKATEGAMTGRELVKLPSTMTTWRRWRELHPDTTVYVKPSEDYAPRFTGSAFREFTAADDGPVRAEDLIVGVEGHVEARAYLVRRLAGDRLLLDMIEDHPILVYLSDDLSTARVFSRTVGGRALSLRLLDDEHLEDVETGSRWDPITGEAISGPLKGKRLHPVISTYSLWFAWERYRPDTVIHGESPSPRAAPAQTRPTSP